MHRARCFIDGHLTSIVFENCSLLCFYDTAQVTLSATFASGDNSKTVDITSVKAGNQEVSLPDITIPIIVPVVSAVVKISLQVVLIVNCPLTKEIRSY